MSQPIPPNPPPPVPKLDLQAMQSLFSKGMAYALDHFPQGIFSKGEDLCSYQLNLANNARDLQTFMGAVSIHNPAFNTAFNGPTNITRGGEIGYTNPQFGVSNTGWYYVYGVSSSGSVSSPPTPDVAFEFSFSRQELAPPAVVQREGLDSSECVRWVVCGGFGEVGGTWYNIPGEYLYLAYTKLSDYNFTLVGAGQQVTSVAISSTIPMMFDFNIAFKDLQGKAHTLQVSMIANTPPAPNAPNSCAECVHGMGSMYYSFTDMSVVISPDNQPEVQGNGWIDHQLVQAGVPEGLFLQSALTVANVLASPVSGGWLWFSIQDYESGYQYMLWHPFDTKFYEDDVKLNETIPMSLVNVYRKGVAYFFPTRTDMDISDLDVKLVKFINVNGKNMPAEYNITLPGGKPVVLTLASGPNVYSTPYGPYENPALLKNMAGQVIGLGTIEANGYYTNEEYAQRYIKSAGGNPADMASVNLVASGMNPGMIQTKFHIFLAFMVFLLPLWILLVLVSWIFYDKEHRGVRIKIAVAVMLLVYGFMYSVYG